jgi:hypothetical protein
VKFHWPAFLAELELFTKIVKLNIKTLCSVLHKNPEIEATLKISRE